MSSDPNPPIGEGEENVDVGERQYNLSTGYQVLNQDLTTRPATQQEIDDSGVDETRNQQLDQARAQRVRDRIDAARADVSVPPSIKAFLLELRYYFNR